MSVIHRHECKRYLCVDVETVRGRGANGEGGRETEIGERGRRLEREKLHGW